MKYCVSMVMMIALFVTNPCRSYAQADEIQQLILDVEKLNQFRQILQDMYDGYKILEGGYNKIKEIASGNFKLHEVFLDGLYLVNPAIKKYHKVADIIQYQYVLIKEYKAAFDMLRSSDMFNGNELDYISGVYKNLFNESVSDLDALLMVVTAGTFRMSDDERLQAIDKIYNGMESKLLFLRHFNSSAHLLALQRLKDYGELNGLKSLHGVK